MRILSVITVKDDVVDEVTSFGVFDEQLSSDVVEEAEEKFKSEVLKLSNCSCVEEFEIEYGGFGFDSYIEDGYFSIHNASVNLVWSEV